MTRYNQSWHLIKSIKMCFRCRYQLIIIVYKKERSSFHKHKLQWNLLVLKSKYVARTFEGSVELLTPLTNNLFYNQENMQSSNFLLTTMIAAHFVEQRTLSCFTEKKRIVVPKHLTIEYFIIWTVLLTWQMTNTCMFDFVSFSRKKTIRYGNTK